MTRTKKMMLNSVSSFMYQIITIICGFILPRFFLTYYGSATNGLISSVTHFLSFISFAECGVGAVAQSALYKPLAENDMKRVSEIVVSAEHFFRKIACLLIFYTVILMAIYPLITIETFDYFFTLTLILVIAIGSFIQYFWGITYKILLNADQLGFIQYSIHAATLILNTILSVILIKSNAPIQAVKLTTTIVFAIQPIVLAFVIKKRYQINWKITFDGEPLDQKWNGLAQHIATVVLGNADTAVLTLFSTLENVSVYAVYHLVVNGVKQIVVSMTNGMQAMLGNMLAKNEMKELNRSFEQFEWFIHTIVTLLFSITAITIVPFVSVYTAKITDTNYITPTFAYILTIAQATYCLRLPYNIMVLAAGHYRQTQLSAIIEAVLNIFLSVFLVMRFGLVGVAIGTFVAMAFRTLYFVMYLSKNIIYRNCKFFFKHIVTDMLCVFSIISITKALPQFFDLSVQTYFGWIILSIKIGITALCMILAFNFIVYNSEMKKFFNYRLKKSKV